MSQQDVQRNPGAEDHQLFAVYTYGRLETFSQHFKTKPPFDMDFPPRETVARSRHGGCSKKRRAPRLSSQCGELPLADLPLASKGRATSMGFLR
jgi:hypothetical protein